MERVAKDREILGPLFETFVAAEIAKQLTWIDRSASIFHYRDKDQAEVDVVIEDSAGTVVGIEVKAGATVGARLGQTPELAPRSQFLCVVRRN